MVAYIFDISGHIRFEMLRQSDVMSVGLAVPVEFDNLAKSGGQECIAPTGQEGMLRLYGDACS